MSESSKFLEEIRSAIPAATEIRLTVINDTAILQAENHGVLYQPTDAIWRKLGIVSDVLSVGTPEEIKFRTGVRGDITKLLPSSGAYAVIKQKSADKPAA